MGACSRHRPRRRPSDLLHVVPAVDPRPAPAALTRADERSVLHVLPHPGGGGETYVDTLSKMDSYRFERFYLAPSPRPAEALRTLPRTAATVHLAARRHDLVHVQGEVASAICLPSLALRPSVVTFNGLNLLRRVGGMKTRAAKANLRLVVRAASRTICVSEAERDEVLAAVGARAAPRIVLVHNGVPLPVPPSAEERAAARAALDLGEGVTAAVWLGGLDPVKDPLVAVEAGIEAGRRDARFVLLVAGDGVLQSELERAVAGSDAVRLLGFRRDVRQVLAAADFFVSSSQREGLSFSLLEAMGMGLPVVVSDAPGNLDAVGDAGVTVPRGDVSALADAFMRLLADETERRRLAGLGAERVATKFDAEHMIERTREIYDEVLRG